MKTLLIVGAILQEDGRILLVQQQWEQDPHPYWTIPGGRVEHGEFYAEAPVREVYEETGLMVEKIGGLVYTNHILASDHDGQSIVHVYRVDSWIGNVIPKDPDGFILSARFVPVAEAIQLIAGSQFYAPMRDPVVAYLRGEVPFGTAWQYRRTTVEDVTLVSRLI